jgi:hypothetical protein
MREQQQREHVPPSKSLAVPDAVAHALVIRLPPFHASWIRGGGGELRMTNKMLFRAILFAEVRPTRNHISGDMWPPGT